VKLVSLAGIFLIAITLSACNRTPKPAEHPEKTGTLHGTIVSRNAATKSISIDHEKIEGMMDAMKMSWEVRGQAVEQLPPDGTKIVAVAHEQNDRYWVTDVKAAQ
jgi:Cu/Ag efflux protein CusF